MVNEDWTRFCHKAHGRELVELAGRSALVCGANWPKSRAESLNAHVVHSVNITGYSNVLSLKKINRAKLAGQSIHHPHMRKATDLYWLMFYCVFILSPLKYLHIPSVPIRFRVLKNLSSHIVST